MDNVALLIWIALLLPAAIFLALPRLTPRGYFFGITVPPDFPQTESGREIRRGYALTVAVAFVLGLALGIIVPLIRSAGDAGRGVSANLRQHGRVLLRASSRETVFHIRPAPARS